MISEHCLFIFSKSKHEIKRAATAPAIHKNLFENETAIMCNLKYIVSCGRCAFSLYRMHLTFKNVRFESKRRVDNVFRTVLLPL